MGYVSSLEGTDTWNCFEDAVLIAIWNLWRVGIHIGLGRMCYRVAVSNVPLQTIKIPRWPHPCLPGTTALTFRGFQTCCVYATDIQIFQCHDVKQEKKTGKKCFESWCCLAEKKWYLDKKQLGYKHTLNLVFQQLTPFHFLRNRILMRPQMGSSSKSTRLTCIVLTGKNMVSSWVEYYVLMASLYLLGTSNSFTQMQHAKAPLEGTQQVMDQHSGLYTKD